MMEIKVKNLSEFGEDSSLEFGIQNALARYVRNRWPTNAQKMAQAEWDLTEGRARGVVDAETTLSTLNMILRHKRGGFGFGLMLMTVMFRTSLGDFINQQAGEIENEANERADTALRFRALARRLSAYGPDSLSKRAGRDAAGPEPRL